MLQSLEQCTQVAGTSRLHAECFPLLVVYKNCISGFDMCVAPCLMVAGPLVACKDLSEPRGEGSYLAAASWGTDCRRELMRESS